MDETTLAFEAPIFRAVATGSGDPLDRISVRDHVREVEIGAYRAERGVTQRVRFNVVLEVKRHLAARDDDVDKVISYETIVEAIDTILGSERINLLETLAERLAESCLDDARAVRVFVRIEKLDHISGTLGVEIVRSRSKSEPQIAPVGSVTPRPDTQSHPRIVLIPNDLLGQPVLRAWIDAIAASAVPTIICLEAHGSPMPPGDSEAARQIGLLAIEQTAWVLSGLEPRCAVLSSRAELDRAMKHRQIAVWAPAKMINDAVERPEAAGPIDLALWLAAEFRASEFVSLGAQAVDGSAGIPCRSLDPAHPDAL